MSALPTWMYGDPAEVVERMESAEQRAVERQRIRDVERQQAFELAGRVTDEALGKASSRIVFAPPAIRVKRARIQALTRIAMRERR